MPDLAASLRAFTAASDRPVRIVFADDASSDATPILLSGLDTRLFAHVRCPLPSGQHRAVLRGMAHALRMPDIAMVATMDADMDPPPDQLALLIPLIGHADLVVGYRMGRRRSVTRLAVSLVLRMCCNLLRPSPIRDHGSMFRLYAHETAARCVHLSELGPCLPGLGLLSARNPVEVPVCGGGSCRASRYSPGRIGRVGLDMLTLCARVRLRSTPLLAQQDRR